MVDTTTWIALLVGAAVFVWYWFFRVDSDTTTSFNPTTASGSRAFKSVAVSAETARKPSAPKVSKRQRAKDEVRAETQS